MAASTKPTEQRVIGSLNAKPKTQVDDLIWELENLCTARGLVVENMYSFEVVVEGSQMFNDATLDKHGFCTFSWSPHRFEVEQNTDNGNYSAPRFMKNLRAAIKMLSSDMPLFSVEKCGGCDYCEVEG
jgi:hypothetical protein